VIYLGIITSCVKKTYLEGTTALRVVWPLVARQRDVETLLVAEIRYEWAPSSQAGDEAIRACHSAVSRHDLGSNTLQLSCTVTERSAVELCM
jgi:hypothetical protein